MKNYYYRVNIMPDENPNFCFLRDFPENIGLNRYKFTEGESFGSEYPDNARIYMSEKEQGEILPSLVGNTRGMLIVNNAIKKIVQEINKGPTEYLPISIFNHSKQLVSNEYFIINPIGNYDCLDLGLSEIIYLDKEVVGVDKFVLDREKIKKVPDLFRIKEDPSVYVGSQKLLEKIMAIKPTPTNIYLERLNIN